MSHEADPSSAIADAVAEFLRACEQDMGHKDLATTPTRVARLWSEQFLSGYAMDPTKILGDPVEGEAATELVIIRDLPYHGMCPHHLLPYVGRATVAYLPGTQLVGFGRLGDLVNCFTRRLTLQERACNDIVDALMAHLDARGAGCVMVGEHMCLRIPDNRHRAQVVTASFRGDLQQRKELQDRLWS
ncbi:GTP cyclohydrolase I [Paraliomyxa miuraensis]|uniref:GTP cyclohydrolase I n=1 Tax=Paraliomyxa miuraensis TaxID=376150 RepID=UPI00224F0371|nr:GTP cyclohydrolase I [Paraliomyxa miuraensis]MCX4244938.1 GTP cyclohydrolase I [Paraliomyxa miuraensis]